MQDKGDIVKENYIGGVITRRKTAIFKIPVFAEKTGIGSDLPNGIFQRRVHFLLDKSALFLFLLKYLPEAN